MNKRAIAGNVFMGACFVLVCIAMVLTWRSHAVAWGGHVTNADREIFFTIPRYLWSAGGCIVAGVVMWVWSER